MQKGGNFHANTQVFKKLLLSVDLGISPPLRFGDRLLPMDEPVDNL